MKNSILPRLLPFVGLLVIIGTMLSPERAVAAVSSLGTPSFVTAADTIASYTVPAGTNRLLLVTVSHADTTELTAATAVSFGGQPLTQVAIKKDGAAVDSIWGRVLGTSGSATSGAIVVTRHASTFSKVISFLSAQAFQNVDQTTPTSGATTGNNAAMLNSASTLNVPSAAGDLVLDLWDVWKGTALTLSANGGQTVLNNSGSFAFNTATVASYGGFGGYATSTKPGAAGTVSTGWTSNAEAYIHVALNIKQAAGGAPEIAVTETGIGNVADGGSFAFGTTTVGSPLTKTFTVTNSGDAILNLSGLTVPSGFTIAANFASTVPASGGTTSFQITMSAGAAATPSGTVTFVTDDANENPYNFTISGTVTAPAITGTMMFTQDTGLGDGIAQDGEAGSSDIPGITMQVLNITDTAGTSLGLMSWKNNAWLGSGDAGYSALTYDQNAGTKGMAIKSSDGSEFQLNQFLYYNWGETSSTTITVKGYRNTVEVASTTFAGWINTLYMPITVNLDSSFDNVDDVRLYISAGGYQGDQSATNHSINNIVIAPPVAAPEIAVAGNSVNIVNGSTPPNTTDGTLFLTTVVGLTSNRLFTIQNIGTATLSLSGSPRVAVSGTNASDFVVFAQPAATLAASGSVNVQFNFTPSAAGLRTATVTIANEDSDENPFTFDIAGTGVVLLPEIAVTETVAGNIPDNTGTFSFGTTTVGTPVTKTFTVTNSGDATLNLSNLTVPSGFTIAANFGSSTVAASGGTTTFQITMSAGAAATPSGTLSFTNDDSDENPYNFTISGTVNPPPAEIAVSYVGNDVADGSTVPATLNGTAYGDVPVQGVTVDHVFTITNSGGTALTLGAVTAGGDFTVTQPTSPVAANGGTTSFTVSFNPSTTGLRTATVSFTNSDANESPFTFDVSGTGTPAQTFDLAGNAISNTPFDGGETYIYVTNTAPVITSNGGGPTASVNVAENSTAVTNVTANDTDLPAQTLTYSITGGADMLKFSIVPTTGVLSFLAAPNFEVKTDADDNNVYEVVVTVTDSGAGNLTDTQAISVTVTNVNEMPSFVKGADQLLPYNTSSAQTATGWATAIADGDSTVVQGLTFNISSNSTPGIFTTAPSINSSTGTLTYTPNGTAGTATIGVTLTDDNTINGTAALTTLEQTFTITVQAAPDYTVATTGNVIVVTDLSGNGDTLAVSEPSAGNIQFAAAGRTFSVDGGLQIAGNSGALTRTSVTAITVNAAAGADTINVGAFTGTLPNFTLNGGTGDDTVNFNGDITFAANANLDVDLQNDDVTPGVDNVSVASNANLLTSGTGTITVKVSRNVALASGSSLETVNGGITIEANQQGTATTGSFVGVDVSNGLIRATGTGVVTVLGRGGNSAAGNQMGVLVTNGGDILGGTSGTLTVTGTGGASSGGGNLGVNVFGSATTTISSIGANVQVVGTGGTGGSTAIGVELGTGNTGGRITAGGSGTVTVTGTGGSSVAGLFNHGILMGSATIDSGGGNVSVTGNGGSGNGSTGDHTGIQLDDSTVAAGGSGSVTVVGNAGSAATSQTLLGVDVRFTSTITSSGGNVSVTGTGGNTSNTSVGVGAGVRLIGNGTITAGGTGTVSVTGTGVGGSAIGHEGVVVNGSGFNSNQARIGAANGTTSVTATAGNSASTALVVGTVNAGRISTGSNNAITLTADRMAFGGSAIISSGTGATTLVQHTNGALIDLGAADSATTLGLTDAELDRVTCGTLVIGDSNSGSITVSAPVTRTTSTAMQLISAADILISGGQIDTAGGNLLLDSGTSPAAVKPTLAGTDVTVGTLSFGSDLQIAIAGAVADSGYTQLNVVGSVDLTGVTLALTGAHVPTFGQSFTLVNNDGSDAITGTFTGLAEGAEFTFNGIPMQITYVGGTDSNDVVLRVYMPEIVVHNGSHLLAPELSDGQVGTVDFGSTAPNAASLRSFTVTNSGNKDLTITSITAPAEYLTNGSATTLAPGAAYTFQVSFKSATPGTYSGSIVINNDDLDEPAFDFPVTGTVVAPGSAPVVTVSTDVAVEGPGGSPVLGGPIGSTIYKFIGSPALNSSGVLASAVQIRHADTSLHTGMMVGQPLALIATDSQTAPSLPGVTHYNFGPPVINEVGHIAFTGEVRGAGITTNVNSRCLFSNASDGSLKLVAQVGMVTTLGSNLKTIGNFSIGGDLIIFLGTLVDNSIVLFGWDANTGIRPLMRNGQSLDANGVTKTVKNFSILETGNASSGHGREISVAPTGESLVTLNVTFTDNSSGVVLGSFDGTSDIGFGATYGASQQLADTYASPGVIPLAKWNTFRSPGFDNTGSYYGFISQMATNTLAGVTSTNNVGIFVDTAPGLLTLQLRENDVATSTGGLVFSDFSDLVLGGGDYEFLVKGEVRGSGVVVNVNDKGLWAQHATNGLVLVAREGSEAPGVAGSTFFRLTQIALPGSAQPMFQASMTSGVGGVTAANDTGLWVINAGDDVVLAVREGDVLNVGGTNRTVTAITALLNGTTTGGALGRRVFLADGQLTLLLTFSGGVQANAKVVVP